MNLFNTFLSMTAFYRFWPVKHVIVYYNKGARVLYSFSCVHSSFWHHSNSEMYTADKSYHLTHNPFSKWNSTTPTTRFYASFFFHNVFLHIISRFNVFRAFLTVACLPLFHLTWILNYNLHTCRCKKRNGHLNLSVSDNNVNNTVAVFLTQLS